MPVSQVNTPPDLGPMDTSQAPQDLIAAIDEYYLNKGDFEQAENAQDKGIYFEEMYAGLNTIRKHACPKAAEEWRRNNNDRFEQERSYLSDLLSSTFAAIYHDLDIIEPFPSVDSPSPSSFDDVSHPQPITGIDVSIQAREIMKIGITGGAIGTGTGALAGSVMPVIGTAVGAVGGGITGATAGIGIGFCLKYRPGFFKSSNPIATATKTAINALNNK